MKLVFATNNAHKLSEVQQLLGDAFEIISLDDLGFKQDIPEPFDTLEENSLTKAQTIYNEFGLDCFAEDTGLEIDILNGAPGVLSARYAGEQKKAADNIKKVLQEMKGKTNRNAQFRTVATLILSGQIYQFEGVVKGLIMNELQGDKGFGYDPIFRAEGYDISFAQMSANEKNAISHRGQAIKKLIFFLQNNF